MEIETLCSSLCPLTTALIWRPSPKRPVGTRDSLARSIFSQRAERTDSGARRPRGPGRPHGACAHGEPRGLVSPSAGRRLPQTAPPRARRSPERLALQLSTRWIVDGRGAPGRLSPCSFAFPAGGQTLGRGRRGRSERRARPCARASAARSPPTPGFALVVLVTCSQLPMGDGARGTRGGDGARAGVQGRSLSPPCPSRAGHHRPFVQRLHTARAPAGQPLGSVRCSRWPSRGLRARVRVPPVLPNDATVTTFMTAYCYNCSVFY